MTLPILFGVMKNEIPILNLSREDKLEMGISYDTRYHINGNVPVYEEHSVRISRGYTLSEWNKMSSKDKALEIAWTRISDAIEYHRIEAESRYHKRQSK